MATYGKKSIGGYQLPTDPSRNMGRETVGFVTPSQDLMPQRFSVPPRRVLPIIFIPGIMGSNLRLKADRQRQMGQTNNLAWRPDFKTFCIGIASADAAERQLLLDPDATELDTYEPELNATGDREETADDRNSKVTTTVHYSSYHGANSPLLVGDPPGKPNARTRDQKARARGWGEVFYSSYGAVLELCEEKLNGAYTYGILNEWWRQIVGVQPSLWNASAASPLPPLNEETLRKAVDGCWFPVHAMGYNWLKSNKASGESLGKRIDNLIEQYRLQGYQCKKVIIVTHSMGGLVARALIHPQIGKRQDKVLGIVHGVMPAIGAAATYKRMRCGFEGAASQVLGKDGRRVTAVLANSQGGLELLPSAAYGNAWLKVEHKGKVILSLPAAGDPYEEIYKVQGRWYGLLTPEWINPSDSPGSGFDRTAKLLDRAKKFHQEISGIYHAHSYAHYGADKKRLAWHTVTWSIESTHFTDVHRAGIINDTAEGTVQLQDVDTKPVAGTVSSHSTAKLQPPVDAGDETVPMFSADDQLRSGKFRGIFRQTGYEHQGSFKDVAALHSTLYSIVQIASNMEWS